MKTLSTVMALALVLFSCGKEEPSPGRGATVQGTMVSGSPGNVGGKPGMKPPENSQAKLPADWLRMHGRSFAEPGKEPPPTRQIGAVLDVLDEKKVVKHLEANLQVKVGEPRVFLELEGKGPEKISLGRVEVAFAEGRAVLPVDLAPLFGELIMEDWSTRGREKWKKENPYAPEPRVLVAGSLTAAGRTYRVQLAMKTMDVIDAGLSAVAGGPVVFPGEPPDEQGPGPSMFILTGRQFQPYNHYRSVPGGDPVYLPFNTLDHVALVTEWRKPAGNCKYKDEKGGEYVRERFRVTREVVIHDRRTGKRLQSKTLGSTPPPPCDRTMAVHDLGKNTTAKVEDVAIWDWVRVSFLKLP